MSKSKAFWTINTIYSCAALLHWWPFSIRCPHLAPKGKPTPCISLSQWILLAGVAEGYDWHHFSHIIISRSLGIYSDEHSLQPLSPTPLMLAGTIKTLSVFRLCHLLTNAPHARLRAWKLPAGHPVQPPHSRTHYSSLLWSSNHDSDSSKEILHKTSINTKCI